MGVLNFAQGQMGQSGHPRKHEFFSSPMRPLQLANKGTLFTSVEKSVPQCPLSVSLGKVSKTQDYSHVPCVPNVPQTNRHQPENYRR